MNRSSRILLLLGLLTINVSSTEHQNKHVHSASHFKHHNPHYNFLMQSNAEADPNGDPDVSKTF